jgi:hypothetical protein
MGQPVKALAELASATRKFSGRPGQSRPVDEVAALRSGGYNPIFTARTCRPLSS